MEVHGFFLYLYGLGAAFLVYVLIFAARGRRVVDNHKSHGSVTVRIGALVKSAFYNIRKKKTLKVLLQVFSLGTLVYFCLEMVAFAEVRSDSECYQPTLGANVALALVFVLLQVPGRSGKTRDWTQNNQGSLK